MPRSKGIPAGIGAKGEAMKRFFHPKEERVKVWGSTDSHERERATDVEILDKVQHRISRKLQTAYKCRVPGSDADFYIVCKHFSVKITAGTPFEDEVPEAPAPAPAVAAPDETAALRSSHDNTSNINRGVTAEDIRALRAQGIEVDNEDPAPENAVEPPAISFDGLEWQKPSMCPRRMAGTSNLAGLSSTPRRGSAASMSR